VAVVVVGTVFSVPICGSKLHIMSLVIMSRNYIYIRLQTDRCTLLVKKVPGAPMFAFLTRRSQHSQECKHPRQQCICDSWPWPL